MCSTNSVPQYPYYYAGKNLKTAHTKNIAEVDTETIQHRH